MTLRTVKPSARQRIDGKAHNDVHLTVVLFEKAILEGFLQNVYFSFLNPMRTF